MHFGNPDPRTARQLMDDVMTVNGVPIGWTVDWALTDWNVPAGVFAHQGTWIDALAAIAAAQGGYLCPAGYWTIGYGHLCSPEHPPCSKCKISPAQRPESANARSRMRFGRRSGLRVASAAAAAATPEESLTAVFMRAGAARTDRKSGIRLAA